MKYLTEKEDGTEIETEGDAAVFSALCDVKESLETLLYQYHSLYDRWMDERKTALKWHTEFAKQTQLLAEEVKQLRELNTAVPNSFARAMQETRIQSMTYLKEMSLQAASEHMVETVQMFKGLFFQAENQIRHYQKESTHILWKMAGMAIASSVFTAGLMVMLIANKPQPLQPTLDQDQIHALYNGSMLGEIWPKLTEKEQKRIETLMNEQIRAEKKAQKK
jgi:hypothetical protein